MRPRILIYVLVWGVLLFAVRQVGAISGGVNLKALSLDEIDNLTLAGESIDVYNSYVISALEGMADTLDEDMVFKGEVLLAVVANNITEEIDSARVDPTSTEMKELLATLSEHNFHVYQPPVSRVVKVAYYFCQGRYSYLYDRFFNSWFFYAILPIVLLLIAFVFLQMVGKIRWIRNQTLYYGLTVMLILTVISISLFKATCDNNITEHSIYGIIF